jgi:predicted acyl esterase
MKRDRQTGQGHAGADRGYNDHLDEKARRHIDCPAWHRRNYRMRINITCSNFPAFDRNMNTGNPIGEDAEGIQALQTVFHQANCASYIDLPVIHE